MVYAYRLIAVPEEKSDSGSVQGYEFDLFNPEDSDVASVMSGTTSATKWGTRVTGRLRTLTATVQGINSAVVKHLAEGFSKMHTILDQPGVEKKELLKEMNSQVKRVAKLAEQVSAIEVEIANIQRENEDVTDRSANLQGKLVFAIHYIHTFLGALDGASLKEAKEIATQATQSLVALQNEMDEEAFSDHVIDTLDNYIVSLKEMVKENGDLTFGGTYSEEDKGSYMPLTVANLQRRGVLDSEPDLKASYHTLREQVHAGLVLYVNGVLEVLNTNVVPSVVSKLIAEGTAIFSEQQDGWESFKLKVQEQEEAASGHKKDALTLLLQQVDLEITRCAKAVALLSAKGTQKEILQNIFKHVASFVSCEADSAISRTVNDMVSRVEKFYATRFPSNATDVPVPQDSLMNHVLYGDRLVFVAGLSKPILKQKVENLRMLLSGLNDQALDLTSGKSKLTHYRLLYNVQNFFDKGMPRTADLATPKKK
jgi:hypothetical protein